MTQICSNGGGTSIDLTQLYFGRQAAVNLANQQSSPVSPEVTAPETATPASALAIASEAPVTRPTDIPEQSSAELMVVPQPITPTSEPISQEQPVMTARTEPEQVQVPVPEFAPGVAYTVSEPPTPVPQAVVEPAPEAISAVPPACEGDACL